MTSNGGQTIPDPGLDLGSCSSASTQTDIVKCVEYYVEANSNSLNTFWLIFGGALVFFMQCGFAMLCAGCVRTKNVKNIMLKNLLDACGGAIGYWSLGYAFAYGGEGSAFIGSSNFFLGSIKNDMGYSVAFFFFQWAFAATAATIVAGTVAERCKMTAYFCYSFFLTAFVYPIVTRAFWAPQGWGSAFRDTAAYGDRMFNVGFIDFAGSGVVHLTGVSTALVAAIVLGPRLGRFKDASGKKLTRPADMGSHSVTLQVLGTFILWFGWYGFNPVSTLYQSSFVAAETSALCAVNTTLSAAAAGMSSLALRYLLSDDGLIDITALTNGILGGLVGITSGCAVVWPWAAVVIGIFSGFIYIGASNLLIKLEIDDAVDAIPVHFANGIWGCIATGFFASQTLVGIAYDAPTSGYAGWFYEWSSGSGNGNLLAAQLCGVLFILGWTIVLMTPFFLVLKAVGWFRVDPEDEELGMDISHHGGVAYKFDDPVAKTKDEEQVDVEPAI
jgi:Amt family ammonium transporter